MIRNISLIVVLFVAIPGISPVHALTPEDYVTVKDGHLSRQGKRIRFWGVNMTSVSDRYAEPDKPTDYATIDAGIERLKKLGFNAVRFWGGGFDNFLDYTKGDLSRGDLNDYFLAKLRENGFAVWVAGLNFHDRNLVTPEDVSVIDDPATAEAWKEAVAKNPGPVSGYGARAWDPRLRELGKRQLKFYLDHVNQYTGLRACEDPVFAAWELTNEEWWIPHALGDACQGEPEFFRLELKARWNDWLKKKYGTTADLKKAWVWLLEGESLEDGTVVFAPASEGEVDIYKGQLGSGAIPGSEALKLAKDVFPHARSEDVVQFVMELGVEYKKDLEQFIRSYGEPGLGCQIVPIVFDTGMANQLQNAYLHSQAPVTCAGCYCNQTTPEKQDPRFPWLSGLLESPRMYWDNPWLEHNRVEGRPHFVYEINIVNPSKYRAEFPLRLAALASIQDWDWVCWYVLDGFRSTKLKDPYTQRMNYSYDDYSWNGIHFCYDEVLTAAMKSAGEIFTSFALKPAEHPTVFRFGKKALYDMDMQHYKGFRRSYWGNVMHVSEALGPTTYRYGARLEFDPVSDKAVEIIGPYVRDRAFQDFIVKPTDQITYNWQTGYLQIDTPSAKSIVGFLPETWEFSGGVKLENIHVKHPDKQVYVIPGERYVAVSVVAADGLPLDRSANVTITALSTSFNAGLKVNEDLIKPMSSENPMAGLVWGAKFKELFDYGSEVTTSRVGVTVKGEFLKGRKYDFYDWNLKLIKSGTVEGDTFEIPADLPVTFVDLHKS